MVVELDLTNKVLALVSLAGMLYAARQYWMPKGPTVPVVSHFGEARARLTRRTWLLLFWLNATVLIFNISFGVYRHVGRRATLGAQARIDQLRSPVRMIESIHGTSAGIPAGYTIWVVVRSRASNRFYPQEPVELGAGGSWSSITIFGNESDAGKQFDLFIVVADEVARVAFEAYLSKARDNSYSAGLANIPSTARVLTEISVQRGT